MRSYNLNLGHTREKLNISFMQMIWHYCTQLAQTKHGVHVQNLVKTFDEMRMFRLPSGRTMPAIIGIIPFRRLKSDI